MNETVSQAGEGRSSGEGEEGERHVDATPPRGRRHDDREARKVRYYYIIMVVTEQRAGAQESGQRSGAGEKKKRKRKKEEEYQGAMRKLIRMAVLVRGCHIAYGDTISKTIIKMTKYIRSCKLYQR